MALDAQAEKTRFKLLAFLDEISDLLNEVRATISSDAQDEEENNGNADSD